MSIHYRQYTDTVSILNYLQNHCLWRKNSQNWYYIIQKIIKRSILASHCQVYFRNELPTRLPARLMAFSIRVTSCRYELAVIFTCRLCIDIARSNRHVVSFLEHSDTRYFRQSITALSFPVIFVILALIFAKSVGGWSFIRGGVFIRYL